MTDKIEIKEASVWEWSELDRCAWSTGSSSTVAHERDIPGDITGADRKKLAAFVRYHRDLDSDEWRDPDGNMWEFRRNPETGAPEASIAGGNYWTPFPDETDFFGPGGALAVWAERNPAQPTEAPAKPKPGSPEWLRARVNERLETLRGLSKTFKGPLRGVIGVLIEECEDCLMVPDASFGPQPSTIAKSVREHDRTRARLLVRALRLRARLLQRRAIRAGADHWVITSSRLLRISLQSQAAADRVAAKYLEKS